MFAKSPFTELRNCENHQLDGEGERQSQSAANMCLTYRDKVTEPRMTRHAWYMLQRKVWLGNVQIAD